MKQKGLIPLVIVILIASAVVGYLFYQKKLKPVSIPKLSHSSSDFLQSEVAKYNNGSVRRCGDIPDVAFPEYDKFKIRTGPKWAPNCRHIAWAVWQSGTGCPYCPQAVLSDKTGVFLYSLSDKTVKTIYKPQKISEDFVEFLGWVDEDNFIIKISEKDFKYNLTTNQTSPQNEETADWNSYTNIRYGFTIKFPPGMEEEKKDAFLRDPDSVLIEDSTKSKGIYIYIRNAENYEAPWSGGKIVTITKDNLQLFHQPGPNTVKLRQLQERPAMFSRDDVVDSENSKLSILDGNKVIQVTIGSKGLGQTKLHDQILSSFKFLYEVNDKESWKIFTSTAYNPFYTEEQLKQKIDRLKSNGEDFEKDPTLKDVRFLLKLPKDWLDKYDDKGIDGINNSFGSGFTFNKGDLEIRIGRFYTAGGNSCDKEFVGYGNDYRDISTPSLNLRRVKAYVNTNYIPKGYIRFELCSKEGGYFSENSPLGLITYTLPFNYNSSDLDLMDRIISTLEITQ